MPLFMDVHWSARRRDGRRVAAAHKADMEIHDEYGVKYLNSSADPTAGKVFCLVDAPDAETAMTVHREAHGLVADEIYPVVQG